MTKKFQISVEKRIYGSMVVEIEADDKASLRAILSRAKRTAQKMIDDGTAVIKWESKKDVRKYNSDKPCVTWACLDDWPTKGGEGND